MISHNSKQPGTVISSTYFEYCDFYILAKQIFKFVYIITINNK